MEEFCDCYKKIRVVNEDMRLSERCIYQGIMTEGHYLMLDFCVGTESKNCPKNKERL